MEDVKTATFKDLCPEDRAKIQKLLAELVKVKKEKELLEESMSTQSSNHRRELEKMKADNRSLMDRLRHYMSIISQSSVGDGLAGSGATDRPKSAGAMRLTTVDNSKDMVGPKKADMVSRGTLTEITMQSSRAAETQTVTPTVLVPPQSFPPMPSGSGVVYPYAFQPVMLGSAEQYVQEIMALKAQVAALSSAVPHSAGPMLKSTAINRDDHYRTTSPGSATINSVKISSTSARALGALPSVDDLNRSIPTFSLANSTHLTTNSELEGKHAYDRSALSTDSLNMSTYTPYVPISGSILDAIQETLPNLSYISGAYQMAAGELPGTAGAGKLPSGLPAIPHKAAGTAQNKAATKAVDKGPDNATNMLLNMAGGSASAVIEPSRPYDFSQSFGDSAVEGQRDPSKELLSLINHTHNFVTPPSQCSILPEDNLGTTTQQGPISEGSALSGPGQQELRKSGTLPGTTDTTCAIVAPPVTSFTTPQVYRATAHVQRHTETPVKLEVIEPPSMLAHTPSPAVDHEQLTNRSYTSSSMQPMVSLPSAADDMRDPSIYSTDANAGINLEDIIDLQRSSRPAQYTRNPANTLPNFTERRPFPSDFDPSPPLSVTQPQMGKQGQDVIIKSTVKGRAEDFRQPPEHRMYGMQVSDDTQTVVRFLNL